jgi:transcriptional regulator with XRE-family HTH domain
MSIGAVTVPRRMAQRSQSHAAFGRAVREQRDAAGISQEELAHRSGMHRTYIGGIERGERNLSYTNLLRLARALGVRPSVLLSRAEDLDPS